MVVPEKFSKITEMVRRRYNLRAHKFTRHELMKEGKAREIFELLNTTYKDLYGFCQLSDRQIDKLVGDYIKIADLNLVAGIVDGNENDKLVGFGITFPSFSRALQKTRDGRLFPLWLVASAEDPQMAQDRHRRSSVDRCVARIPCQGCQRTYLR